MGSPPLFGSLPLIGLLHVGALAFQGAADVEGRIAPASPGFLPGNSLYAPYLADPRRPAFSISQQRVEGAGIQDVGDQRTGIQIGSRFGLARWGAGAFGLDAEVGFLGAFDDESSTDNIGWDGLFGFDLVWQPRDTLTLRLGAAHDSAHVGDELIERTGRTRLDYTREELRLGASLSLTPAWRSYAELAWAYTLRNEDVMEPGRWQAGLEFDAARGREDSFHPYWAVDVSGFEEDDWEPNLAAQLGVVRHSSGGGILRAGLEVVSGRSPLGEFSQDRETYLALGIWIDP